MSSSTDHPDHNKLINIIIASPKIKPSQSQIKIQEEMKGDELEYDHDDCHTPRKDENKIPIMFAPPPPPQRRKPGVKRKIISCKRKLFGVGVGDGDGIQVVKSEEIDAFFKSSFEELAAAAGNSARILKKRCKCT